MHSSPETKPKTEALPYPIFTPDQEWSGTGALRPSLRAVYLCENRHGEIIYVGRTRNWWERRTAHRSGSPWWHEVRRIHVIPVPLIELRTAETFLLAMLQPVHNKAGTARDQRRGPRVPESRTPMTADRVRP